MSATRYFGKDNYGRPKREYLEKLAAMTDEQLTEETEKKIWLSAYANNNPRSDYHWNVDACYDEWQRRGKGEEYTAAYGRFYKQCCG